MNDTIHHGLPRKAIAVIGTSLHARGWAIVFARGGYDVRLYSPDATALAGALAEIAVTLTDLEDNFLLNGLGREDVAARISLHTDLASAVSGAVHVQDNTDGLQPKRDVFSRLDGLVSSSTTMGSTNVGLMPSQFADHLANRDRVLLLHTINPALTPVVQVVGGEWVKAEIVQGVCDMLAALGLRPLRLNEFSMLIIDRLTAVVVEEAMRLVAGGFATVEQVDACVSDGLARRWVIAGPFETMDLTLPGGIGTYLSVAEQGFGAIFEAQQNFIVPWAGELARTVCQQRRAALPEEKLPERARWRDREMARLEAFKQGKL